MLPYTTYHIPETKDNQTDPIGQWLWMIIPEQDSGGDHDLLRKISTALKADFGEDVYLVPHTPGEALSLPAITGSEPKLVISFGTAPDQLGIWIDMVKPGLCKLEAFTFILTLSPVALSNNAAAKKELWRQMQSFLESHPS